MTFWQQIGAFCGVLAIWSGLLIAVLKWMLDGLATRVDGFHTKVHALELDLERFRREAAQAYVKREDWIQIVIGLEGKLDRALRRRDDDAR